VVVIGIVQIVEYPREIFVAQRAQLHPTAIPGTHVAQQFVFVSRAIPMCFERFDDAVHVHLLPHAGARI